MNTVYYDKSWRTWGWMIDHSPAPRYRRKIILKLIKKLQFNSLLDIGCGNGQIMQTIYHHEITKTVGIDISQHIVDENFKKIPQFRFYCIDIEKQFLNEKFDLVIMSEILEHLSNPQEALKNASKMCHKYLILTMPGGKIFSIDKMMHHIQHFSRKKIEDMLMEGGFVIKKYYEWGFPFHTLYKHLINMFPNYFNTHYAERKYSPLKKMFSNFIYFLFFFNINKGYQIFVLAEKYE